jgi:hypothetical protein
LQIPGRTEITLSQPSVIAVAALNPREAVTPHNAGNSEVAPTPDNLSTARPIVIEAPCLPPELETDFAANPQQND